MASHRRIGNVGLVIILLLAFLVLSLFLFFADGGQLKGINENHTAPGNFHLDQPVEIDGLTIVVIDEDIVPLEDGTEIIPIEIWQLPPREMIIHIITSPMAHIPLSTGKLISILYLLSGFAFIIAFSAREDIKRNQEPGARPEQILTYITDHPCHSQQQIAEGTGIPRSSLRHYLHRMQENKKIKAVTYNRTPYYLPYADPYTSTEKLVLVILSREKEHRFFAALAENPGIANTDLADLLQMNTRTTQWYLSRLKKSGLMMSVPRGDSHCFLTPDAAEAYRKLGRET